MRWYLVGHRKHSQLLHRLMRPWQQLLRHLIIQQGMVDPVLVEHSMGGKVAIHFAQTSTVQAACGGYHAEGL